MDLSSKLILNNFKSSQNLILNNYSNKNKYLSKQIFADKTPLRIIFFLIITIINT